MDDAVAQEVIAAAAGYKMKRTLRVLYLADKQLTVVGDDVARLTDLQELWLEGNALTRVPARLDRLVALRVLILAGNRLETLPDAVGKLTDLQQLWLDNNRLTQLPATFTKLTSLVELRLGCEHCLRVVMCNVCVELRERVPCVVELLWALGWLTVRCVCAGNRFGEEGAGDVVQMCTAHPKLLSLSLGGE